MQFFDEVALEVRQDLLEGSLDLSFNPVSESLTLNDHLDFLCKVAFPDVFQLHAFVRVVQCGEDLGDSLNARGKVRGFDTLQL